MTETHEDKRTAYLPVATVKLCGRVTAWEVTEALVTAVHAVRAVVAHQRVWNVILASSARERGRKWLQRRPTGTGSSGSIDPACTCSVASEHLVCHVTIRTGRDFESALQNRTCEVWFGREVYVFRECDIGCRVVHVITDDRRHFTQIACFAALKTVDAGYVQVVQLTIPKCGTVLLKLLRHLCPNIIGDGVVRVLPGVEVSRTETERGRDRMINI